MDDAICLAGLFVKSETFQKGGQMVQTTAAICNIVFIQGVPFNGLHHQKGRRHISIQFPERHDRLQQIRYFDSIGMNDLRSQGMRWKIGIGQYDGITMSHFA